ncbi:LOW QUALITY PROTEIN: uncharacterized protein [Argopecten irradians]|uniref:LOW QUALITY PROTEIN: uncharacterized protein n=1 Tax=Argopecten irradians TaxID=31199 RepID=UPI003720E185
MELRRYIFVILCVVLLCIANSEGKKKKKQRGQKGSRAVNVDIRAPRSGQRVRLGGSSQQVNAGLVEVFRGGTWGVVCNEDWDLSDAKVVCQQLGFNRGALAALTETAYGTAGWTDDDILMNNINCMGYEDMVQECQYGAINFCPVTEAASVMCKHNTGCEEGWVAGPDSCYQFNSPKRPVKALKQVLTKCARAGGHLVNIETEKENNFLSNTLQLLYPDSDYWLIGGKIHKGKWYWEKHTVREQKKPKGPKKTKKPKKPKGPKSTPRPGRRPRPRPGPKRQPEMDHDDSDGPHPPSPPTRRPNRHGNRGRNKAGKKGKKNRRRSKRAAKKKKVSLKMERDLIVYKKWFPGWVPTNESREPSRSKREYCMVLNNLYDRPDILVKQLLDYYYWDNVPCKRRTGFNFICEKPKNVASLRTNDIDCYEGNGAGYRGNMDLTVRGSPCQNWTVSDRINPQTHPNKGLGAHNFCRNPDNEVRPWCWVDADKVQFGYCPLFPCTDLSQEENNPDVRECYEGNGENYRGSVSRTIRGSECQRWTQSVHINPDTYPDMGLGDHNLCRNPDKSARPWCWTNVTCHHSAVKGSNHVGKVSAVKGSNHVGKVSAVKGSNHVGKVSAVKGSNHVGKVSAVVKGSNHVGKVSAVKGSNHVGKVSAVKGSNHVGKVSAVKGSNHVGKVSAVKGSNHVGKVSAVKGSNHVGKSSNHVGKVSAVKGSNHVGKVSAVKGSNHVGKVSAVKGSNHVGKVSAVKGSNHVGKVSAVKGSNHVGKVSAVKGSNHVGKVSAVKGSNHVGKVSAVKGSNHVGKVSAVKGSNHVGKVSAVKGSNHVGKVSAVKGSNHVGKVSAVKGSNHVGKVSAVKGSNHVGKVSAVKGSNHVGKVSAVKGSNHVGKVSAVKGSNHVGKVSAVKGSNHVGKVSAVKGSNHVGKVSAVKGSNHVGKVSAVKGSNHVGKVSAVKGSNHVGKVSAVKGSNHVGKVSAVKGSNHVGKVSAVKGSNHVGKVSAVKGSNHVGKVSAVKGSNHVGKVSAVKGSNHVGEKYKVPQFEKFEGAILNGTRLESYIHIPIEKCASKCLETREFVCRSFSYNRQKRSCFLTDINTNLAVYIDLEPSEDHDYYELSSQTVDCFGMFQCTNGRCINTLQQCDGTDDCGDFSDEINDRCAEPTPDGGTGDGEAELPLEVRMVDGDKENSGRVEIRYKGEWGVICDDKWDINDARVICHMLGYNDANKAVHMSEFGSGNGNFLLDDVGCVGNETSIEDCPKPRWKEHNCKQYEVAGVECNSGKGIVCVSVEFSCTKSEKCIAASLVCNGVDDCGDQTDEQDCVPRVKLVDGTSERNGRVELTLNGVVGSVCDDLWDDNDASVVCRMLGYQGTMTDIFGEGSGDIVLDDVRCEGTESSLNNCTYRTDHNCGHSEDVGVLCFYQSDLVSRVFLVDGPGPYAGRLQVQHNGVHGTVCDDEFDNDNAQVVCRMLGFTGGIVSAEFSAGVGQIWMDNVICDGTEKSLFHCQANEWGVHDCSHEEDVGVQCDPEMLSSTRRPSTPSTGRDVVRLITGEGPHEGRLEVLHNNVYGTVCDDGFEDEEAGVVCRMLGYRDGYVVSTEFFGPGDGEILLDDLDCDGSESSLLDCRHSEWGVHNCNHGEDVGVKCQAAITTTTTQVYQNTISLADGTGFYEGRIIVHHRGIAGTICDDDFGDEEAYVVCKMLGFRDGTVVPKGTFPRGEGEIWLDNLECVGEEETLWDCRSNGWGVHNCNHGEDVGVRCTNNLPTTPKPDIVRLVGGRGPHEGRILIEHTGVNGTVCDDYFDEGDARVVCRTLGYRNGMKMDTSSYGQGEGEIWLDDVACTGEESTLWECPDLNWGTHNCNHGEDVGVMCTMEEDLPISSTTTAAPLRVELVNGPDSSEGRVEVIRLGTRGTICDDNWGPEDARVVCRMLGYIDGRSKSRAAYGPGSDQILLDDVACTGEENSLMECTHAGWGIHNCDHSEDAGAVCLTEPFLEGQCVLWRATDSVDTAILERGTVDRHPYVQSDPSLYKTSLFCRRGVLLADTPTSRLTRAWPYTVSCPATSTELANCTLEENLNADDCPPSSYVSVSCTSEIDPSTAHHTEVVCPDSSVTIQCAGGLEIVGATYGRTNRQTCPASGSMRNIKCKVNGAQDLVKEICNGRQKCDLHDVMELFSDLTDRCEGTTKYLTVYYNCGIDVQLVDGDGDNEGRVEVIIDGQRGTVCDDNWSDVDSSVVCRMLGYDRGGIALNDAHFGRGSTDIPILMDEVDCDGSETSLLSCSRAQGHDCGHHEDAGVRCITTPKPPTPGGEGGDDDSGGDGTYIFPGCGKRPLETIINARKKRETRDGERVLGEPPRVEKIIGGNNADYGMFPWQVGVRLINYVDTWDNTKYHQHWCGATIISEYWILSAAHCFDGLSSYQVMLLMLHKLNKLMCIVFTYPEVTYNNDIALLKIKTKNGRGIVFNDFIQPACLPTSNTEYTTGKRCHISGWGKTEQGTPHMLKQAIAPLISQHQCIRLYSKSQITDAMLCAGLVAGGVDTCQGDSGGPLVCEETTGVYTLYGATSWGAGCGQANAPGVYTHIKHFLPWIRDKLKTHS